MTEPLAVFTDPVAAALEVLRVALADRDELYAAGVTFSNHRPPPHQAPHVQVALDGDRPEWPIITRVLLRVTCWHRTEPDAYDLAQLCQALLLAHSGSLLVACSPGSGPVPGADPDNGDSFATLTVNAVVRSTPA